MKISGGCAKESLDEVEEQSDIEADGDINSAMPPKSQMSLRHTVSQFMTIWNGPMADFYYAQQKALGHVVEGMRLRFQLRGQIRCLVNVFEAWGREAMVLPPSLVDSSESISDIDTDIDSDTDCNRNSFFLTRFIKWARPAIGFPYTWDWESDES